MRKRTLILTLLLVFALLTGCAPSESTEPTPTETVETTPSALPAAESTEPATQTPTEPPPVLNPGPSVYVNGSVIGAAARDGDMTYVSAADFCIALGGTANADGTSTLPWQDSTFTFSPESTHIIKDSKVLVLQSPVLKYYNKAYLPLREICDMLELSVYWDGEEDTVYCTRGPWPSEIPAGTDVPVLMYHAVSNDLWGISSLFVKPERMEEQLRYLTENGYDTIFFEDLAHIEDYDKPVILTFDDGYADNYTELLPLLRKYNAKATVFIITDSMNTDLYLSTDQIREMAGSGLVSIQSHTASHPNLDTLSLESQQKEMERSKLEVTRLTLREPYVLCYPTGRYNGNTLQIIGEYYRFGIKMNGGMYNTSDSPFEVNRYFVSRSTTLDAFRIMIGE